MSTAVVMDKIRAARAVATLPRRTARAAERVCVMIGQLEPGDARDVVRTLRARLAEMDMVALDPELLARVGAGWVAAIDQLASTDGLAAAELLGQHLRQLEHIGAGR